MAADDEGGGGTAGPADPADPGRREGAIAPSGRRAHAAPRSATSGALSAVVVLLVLVGVVLLAARCGSGTAGAPTVGSPATAAPAPAPSAAAPPVPPRAPGSAAPPAADAAARTRLGAALQGTPLLFDGNGMVLRPGADATLDRVAAAAREAPDVALVVTGHTAPVDGDPAWCRRLSQMRADMVADRLRAAGVAPERLRTVGVSHMYPAATWAASRRVEVAPG